MYILIGGGGQVGYYLTKGLLEQGHEVLLLEKDSRRMTHAEDKIWKRDMVNNDLAMHMALDHARESAGRGDLETAMESFQWIVRTCRDCHKIAAKP